MKYLKLVFCFVFMGVAQIMARPTDTLVRVNRELPAFTRIVINDGVEVVFTTGDYACTIECKPGNDVYLVTTVSKSVLTVKSSSLKIGTKLYLSAPRLEAVEIRVAGSFTAENPIIADNIEFELKGTASIRTNGIRAKHVTIRQSGTTSFSDKESVISNSTEAILYGVGNMQYNVMSSKKISLAIKGSGMLKVLGSLTSPLLDVSVNGLGNLQCEGIDAQQTSASLKGAGIIRLSGETVSLQTNLAGLGILNTDRLIISK